MKVENVEGEFLSIEDIIKTHDKIIEESKFNDKAGFIDGTGKLLEGAVFSVFAGYGGIEAYPTIEEKAARLCFNIISSHCFNNANKRTGLMVMLETLEMNEKNACFDQEKLYEQITGIGEHKSSYEQLLEFVKSGQRKNEQKGEAIQ